MADKPAEAYDLYVTDARRGAAAASDAVTGRQAVNIANSRGGAPIAVNCLGASCNFWIRVARQTRECPSGTPSFYE